MKLTIPISVPDARLRPNGSRGNQFMAREAKRQQRKEACDAARVVLQGATPPRWKEATYRIIAHTKAQWDDDNMIAALKGARDGLKDAGIVLDDRGLKIVGVEFRRAMGRPFVLIEVEGEG